MHDIAILDADRLLIGRQVRTDFDTLMERPTLDDDGNTTIEPKHRKRPREASGRLRLLSRQTGWVLDRRDQYKLAELVRHLGSVCGVRR